MKTSLHSSFVLIAFFLLLPTIAAADEHTQKESRISVSLSDNSIYQLQSRWVTQSGASMQLKDLQGNVVVLAMGYLSCQYACPITIGLMKNIEASVAPERRSDVRFVFVTFDPEHDTPAVATKYLAEKHLAADSWLFLQGAPDDIRELAVLLGIKYKRDTAGGFAHSNVITLLNPAGEISSRHESLGSDLTEFEAALQKVLPAKNYSGE